MAHLAQLEERGPLLHRKLALPWVCARLQDPQPQEPLGVHMEVCRHRCRRPVKAEVPVTGAGGVGSQAGERGRAKGGAAAHMTLVESRIFHSPLGP